LPGQGRALRLGDIEGQRTLVAIGGEEIGALAGFLAVGAGQERWAPAAGVVAGAGPLDLDHIGAEVAQQLGAAGSRQHAGEIEDPQAVERAGHGSSAWILWDEAMRLVAQPSSKVKRGSRLPRGESGAGLAETRSLVAIDIVCRIYLPRFG
jgi:hypothetical protein